MQHVHVRVHVCVYAYTCACSCAHVFLIIKFTSIDTFLGTAPVAIPALPALAWSAPGNRVITLNVGTGIPQSDRPSFLIKRESTGVTVFARVIIAVPTALTDVVTYTIEVPSAFAGSNITLTVGAFDNITLADRGLYQLISRSFTLIGKRKTRTK